MSTFGQKERKKERKKEEATTDDMANLIRDKLKTKVAKVARKVSPKVWERFGQAVLSNDTIAGYVVVLGPDNCATIMHKVGSLQIGLDSGG